MKFVYCMLYYLIQCIVCAEVMKVLQKVQWDSYFLSLCICCFPLQMEVESFVL